MRSSELVEKLRKTPHLYRQPSSQHGVVYTAGLFSNGEQYTFDLEVTVKHEQVTLVFNCDRIYVHGDINQWGEYVSRTIDYLFRPEFLQTFENESDFQGGFTL